METRRILAGLALTVGVLVALPALPAQALPARSGDVADAPEPVTRPPVSRPPSSPTAPTAPLSMVTAFTVTSDSVIATATVQYTETGSLVTVRWGDDTRSIYDPSSPMPFPGTTQSGNTVVFKHEYAAGLPATYIATATVEKGTRLDVESRQVAVAPRYVVTQFQAFFAPSHCDSAVEEYTEWSITQKLNGTTVRNWRKDIKTNSFPGASIGTFKEFGALEGSLLSREMTMADAPMTISYTVTELDPVFDDDLGSKSVDLHPSVPAAHVLLEPSGDDCRAQIKFDTDVLLLRPGAYQGGPGNTGGVLSSAT